jgi:hypothetical protein
MIQIIDIQKTISMLMKVTSQHDAIMSFVIWSDGQGFHDIQLYILDFKWNQIQKKIWVPNL